jgi:hypothetical protein
MGPGARLSVRRVAERSVVVGSLAPSPLRLLAPDSHGRAAWVYQSTLGGGFVGRDDVTLDVEVEAGATLFLSSQAAGKVYRRADARFRLDARVAGGATLVSWPDPTMCFAGAAFDQSQRFRLAASASLIAVDYTVYVIDVAGGDKVPRKGGPGITQSDLLVINKTDLAPLVGADLSVMTRDAARMRGAGPTVLAQVVRSVGVPEIVAHILSARAASLAPATS